MKLFYYKPKIYNPLLIIISKISSEDEYSKLEALTEEIFQILIEQKEATENNIIIFSIIKDYTETTQNLILPSINSNKDLVERCHKDIIFMNSLITNTINNSNCEFVIEFTDNKILLHLINLNLSFLSNYYSLKNKME
jgi:hypothetical protein